MKRKPAPVDPVEAGQVMTVDQVAAYLQLNRLTVYRYVREGRIPAAKIGKLYRIFRADVNRFLEAQRVGAPVTARRRPSKVARSASPPMVPTSNPRQPEVAYAGPHRLEQIKEKILEREQLDLARYSLEWTMRGLH